MNCTTTPFNGKNIPQILASRPYFFEMAQNLDLRCVLVSDPGTLGAGAKTRLESRIKKFTPHCVCIQRVTKVITTSLGSTLFIYFTVGLAGFVTFGANVKPDVLINYPENALFSCARVAITLLVAFSYPLQVHPARKCLFSLYKSTSLLGTPPPEGRCCTLAHQYFLFPYHISVYTG